MLKILNVIVIGFLAIPLSSFGAVITYTSDVFSGSILEGGLYGRIGVTMSVPQFNPALGNLNNINFLQVPSIVTAVITVGGSINFFSGICLEGSALLLIRVTSSSSLFLSQGLENRVAAVSNRRCDQDDVSTHIIPFPVFFYIPQVDLSPFIGTGSVSIPLELRSELRVEDSWTRVMKFFGEQIGDQKTA